MLLLLGSCLMKCKYNETEVIKLAVLWTDDLTSGIFLRWCVVFFSGWNYKERKPCTHGCPFSGFRWRSGVDCGVSDGVDFLFAVYYGHPLGRVMLVMADGYPSGCGCGWRVTGLIYGWSEDAVSFVWFNCSWRFDLFIYTQFSVCGVLFYAIYIFWESKIGRSLHRGRKEMGNNFS